MTTELHTRDSSPDAKASAPNDAGATEATIDLALGGMTCAACASRIEKRLNRVPGAEATVNFALERATVHFNPATVGPDELVDAVTAIGYSATTLGVPGSALTVDATGDAARSALLRSRLLFGAVAGLPVVLLSMIPALQFPFWQWIVCALSIPIVLWSGWPFHRSAAMSARHAVFTMDTLVSLGALVALAWSMWALFFGGADGRDYRMEMTWTLGRDPHAVHETHLFFEVAVAVVVFLTLGRWLEARARRRAGSALQALLTLGAQEVGIIRRDEHGADVERRSPIAELRPGMRFAVRPGERIATDGSIETGESTVDRSLVTGESVPVGVGPGDAVVGATLNVDGHLVVRATRVGADTALARIGRLVSEAQSGKAQVQRIADRVAGVFVPIVLVLSVVTFVAWIASSGTTTEAFTAAVSVLIIACPCALGLATPMALLVGTGRGAQLGLLVRGPEALERARHLDTVVFDKTGTLTTGRMELVETAAALGMAADDAIRLAAAAEAGSQHPIAGAINRAAEALGRPTPAPSVTGFVARSGAVEAMVDGVRVEVGRPSEPDVLRDDLRAALSEFRQRALTVVELRRDGEPTALFGVADVMRPTSADAVRRLRSLGLRPMLVSGDDRTVAEHIGAALGITDVVAGVLPEQKVAIVAALQADGHRVAMVGDGVNDAAALATADLGIAMGTGTDVAMESSDITLLHPDLVAAADAVRLARATLRTIHGNLFWAFAYNAAAIPLAAFGLLNPVIAAAAMAGSSLFVVANSLRLRRFA